ncbi:MAG: polysaccharide biosynthesis/export family protein [Opitutaceae bacterium]|jgi:protein involved in polysaccharide export with SLBB domain
MIPPVSPPPCSNSSIARIRRFWLAAGLGGALLLCACATHGVRLRRNGEPLQPLAGGDSLMPQPAIFPYLSPLDQVRVQILPVDTAGNGLALEPYDTVKYEFNLLGDSYQILPGDELTVQFAPGAKTELALVVRPDGKISLPDAGEVTAMGKTPTQLADDIDTAYRSQMKRPSASVTVAKSSLSLDALSGEAVVQDDGTISIPKLGRTAAAGLGTEKLGENLSALALKRFGASLTVQVSRQIPSVDKQKEGLVGFDQVLTVASDGRLALPEIGTFAAAGNTTPFLQTEIEKALRSRYKSPLTVSIEIEESTVRVIYVDGEVGHPGAYPLSPNMTLLKAVTLAGGIVPTGDLRRVTLIHRDSLDNVYVYNTNLKDFIEKGAKDNDLALSTQDIVVVPKSAVAKADQWVDQYITQILPFSRSAGYSYTQGTVKPLSP